MPVERYTVGRVGTERTHAKADMDDPAAVLEVMEGKAARGPFTAEARISNLERQAVAILKRNGKPIDPDAPDYADPTWQREEERYSLVWYAIEILSTAALLRRMIERGDASMAADVALDLGELVTEAKFIQVRIRPNRKGGLARREEIEQRHEEWREEARQKWAKRPLASTTDIAGKIAKPAGVSLKTVWPVIADLKPKAENN
jgi:hypothetical protein